MKKMISIRRKRIMRKLFVAALSVLTVLSLCLLPAFAEAAQAPDETAAVEFNHKVYEANRLDALFSRHESVAYAFSYPVEPGRTWFVWETREGIYQEWGTYCAQLDRDRIVYSMRFDEASETLSAVCGVNIDPDYDPLYSFVMKTEQEFFDTEHDHVLEISQEDGLIHLVSEFDETLSQKYVEQELGMEYVGQTIRTELFLDADTLEILKSVETLVQDGEETEACVIDVEYDTPEPVASRTLRAGFERASENMMTVTFVVDGGTDHEFSRALTVPTNSEAGQVFGDTPWVCFSDADCETLSHWDRMSDRTIYIFTNPDDELNDKYQALLAQVQQATEPA